MHYNESRTAIGIDIGGSHITAALVDLDRRTLVPGTGVRLRLDPHGPAADIIGVWSRAIRQVQADRPVRQAGIAMPGPFDYERGISLIRQQNKYDALYGLNVKELLAEALSCAPEHLRLSNDAACFLQGEAFAGAVSGFDPCVGLTLGTGLGSAVCRTGEAENLDLWSAPFRDGIAEDYLSTRWFLQRYEALAGSRVEGVKELVTAVETDRAARQVFDEFAGNLAEFLCLVMEKEAPRAIVLGGNIAQAYALFESAAQETTRRFPGVRIVPARLGESAALLGAASLWRSATPVRER